MTISEVLDNFEGDYKIIKYVKEKDYIKPIKVYDSMGMPFNAPWWGEDYKEVDRLTIKDNQLIIEYDE